MAALLGPLSFWFIVTDGEEPVFSAGATAAVTVFTVPACVIIEGWTFFVGEGEEGSVVVLGVVLGLGAGDAFAGVELPLSSTLLPPALATEAARPVSCTDQALEPPPMM